jgi:Cof subfamily protein (haloacid dehalogenase superfamily)
MEAESSHQPGTYPPAVGAIHPDIRLIAADMDGTLLDDKHELHEHFWPLIDELHSRGILFCPASGRQYYNLRERFDEIADDVVFIAENGTYVVHQGREISSNCLTADDTRKIVGEMRRTTANGVDAGIVVCGKQSAYVERTDQAFMDEVSRYYARLRVVDDVLSALEADEILKVSVFDFGNAEHTTAPALVSFHETHLVTVSGAHWIDITARTANKGQAVRNLQQTYGITTAQTMVFGDFLNDLEMMDTADYSFAMHNAHPALKARARYIAPSNIENGVVRTISSVLGLRWTK